ncbi:Succinate-semialdehyde dehydrogenase [NADP(+)] [Rosistilla carotiformis]|uniref:Succinate-semialdehyde dehydrogenase [NADP(+)] n=1 Tax=Rosistilla carotiformis TaxID=2528017 RepID=A0A518JWD6_9BACT|nr:aldehyde dehydrogenase family protein [Rosistilla carotiformis]QDV69844.1 Succinate-semialdehyde dehydrogenase [NADP(+)] [Rosistilla carotiformis]
MLNARAESIFSKFGLPVDPQAVAVGGKWSKGRGNELTVRSPVDATPIASLTMATSDQVAEAIAAAQEAFVRWRIVPAPVRGELVRQIGQSLRSQKSNLAELVSWEMGKIMQEALGEVQEMIDVCDFAVGLSRQLYGKTIASERPLHRLAEQWHPLGPVGVISAFNFPVAVWAWNAMIALVCGDPVVWKPSEKAPLSALACHGIASRVAAEMPEAPEGLLSLLIGDAEVGKAIADAPGLPLVSATGSVPMGRDVAVRVASRLGRSLLELGGNNGMIVAPSADFELATRSILFAAVGTCGQRCTSLRRLYVHESIADQLTDALRSLYGKLPIGDPMREGILVGPLIDEPAFVAMQAALATAREQGGAVFGGDRVVDDVPQGGYYVRPAIVEIQADAAIVQQETFAPILYVMRYEDLSQAIAMHNGVPQGLASAILTNDVREAELFCSPAGSDCGIVNVNIGTSGAEIGGAFGGEKETGGGRESGSDAWKAYMRRSTNTINYSRDLPLAQGIQFDLG